MTLARIQTRFQDLSAVKRSALITFITAGDPTPAATAPLMHALVKGGADLIELGMPFSDPMAEGPVIQRASERALAAGMSITKVLDAVSVFREQNSETPIILMGYLNPVETMGYDAFAKSASTAGVDGVLIVDLPPEEASDLNTSLRKSDLAHIFLVAPNSPVARIERLNTICSGFVYYVSVKGVTGDKSFNVDEAHERVEEIKSLVALPVGVGFGIKSAESAAAAAGISDAVIVGSANVEIVERANGDIAVASERLEEFVGTLRRAMDDARAAA